MKTRILLSLLFLLFSPIILFAQLNSPEVIIRNCAFNSNKQNGYLETYIAINPQTLSYRKQSDSTYQATLTGTIIFKNEKMEIVSFDKFEMQSPKYKSAVEISNANDQLLNLRRNALASGNYTAEFEIVNDKLEFKKIEKFNIIGNQNKNYFSDVVFIDTMYESKKNTNFTKGNYEIIPMVLNYFPFNKNQITFLTEFYPLGIKDLKGKVLYQISIAKKETGKVIDEFSSSFTGELNNDAPIVNAIDITK